MENRKGLPGLATGIAHSPPTSFSEVVGKQLGIQLTKDLFHGRNSVIDGLPGLLHGRFVIGLPSARRVVVLVVLVAERDEVSELPPYPVDIHVGTVAIASDGRGRLGNNLTVGLLLVAPTDCPQVPTQCGFGGPGGFLRLQAIWRGFRVAVSRRLIEQLPANHHAMPYPKTAGCGRMGNRPTHAQHGMRWRLGYGTANTSHRDLTGGWPRGSSWFLPASGF